MRGVTCFGYNLLDISTIRRTQTFYLRFTSIILITEKVFFYPKRWLLALIPFGL